MQGKPELRRRLSWARAAMALFCLLAAPALSGAGIIENPSFEAGSGNSAAGWNTHVVSGRHEFVVLEGAHTGARCVAIRTLEEGVARWYTVDVFLLEAARYRLSCWVRSEGSGLGQVWLPDGEVSLSFRDVPEWRRLEAEFSVKTTGRHGLYLQSHARGTVLFDDLAVTLVEARPLTGDGVIPTNGKPLVGIVVPDDSGPTEGYLAVDARRILKQMTDVTLPVLARGAPPPAPGRLLYIGCSPNPGRCADDLARVGPEGVVMDVTPDAVACLGNTPRGTFYAVQELFTRLGCRWYMPWDGGECIPKASRLSLPPKRIVHRPSFALRGGKTIQVYCSPPDMKPEHVDTERWVDWAARNRLNGLKASYPQGWDYGAIRGHEYTEFSGHTLYTVLPPGEYFESHPEFYTLVKGKRTATHSSGRPSQVCVSNEEAIWRIADYAIEYFDSHPHAERFGICAEDEPSYWCECARCRALDTALNLDWTRNGEECMDLTDRWMWFINRIAARVAAKHPTKWIHTFAYGSTREVPRRYRPRANVMIELTWWDRCFKHRMEDPRCEVNRKGMARLAAWSKLAPIAIYGYLDYQYIEAPGPYFHADADFYRTVHRRGVRHVSDEWDTTHTASPLLLNLRARLLWDVATDTDRYIRDFCRIVYGRAAAPVLRYFLCLERAVAQAPSKHVSFNDLAKFTPRVLAEAHRHLDEADRLAAGDTVLQGRLARLRVSLLFTEVCQLTEKASKDPKFYAGLGQLKRATHELIRRHNVPIVVWTYPMLDLKYEPPVEALTGRRLLQLPEQWWFQPDPHAVGEREQWYAKSDFASWKPISIHAAWEGQGYPGMDGDGWYALRAKLPRSDARRVFLLFEAVDETLTLWINGVLVGKSTGDPGAIWDKPQAVDITGKYRPDDENTLVVRVHDIGWAGGIWKPVWLVACDGGQ